MAVPKEYTLCCYYRLNSSKSPTAATEQPTLHCHHYTIQSSKISTIFRAPRHGVMAHHS